MCLHAFISVYLLDLIKVAVQGYSSAFSEMKKKRLFSLIKFCAIWVDLGVINSLFDDLRVIGLGKQNN